MPSVDAASLVEKASRPVSPKTIPRRSCSGDTTSKEACRKNGPRRSVTMPQTNHKSRSVRQPSPSTPTSYTPPVRSLDPRPLDQLLNEHSYLLHNLQKQGDRATRLFHRYAAVEARLSTTTTTSTAITASETRKCKKEAALLKTKIAESTQQEQLIHLRLGEIHVELQNRSRWMLVHHQQHHQPPPISLPLVYPPPLPPPSLSMSPSQTSDFCHLSLGPSPCHEHGHEHEREQEQAPPSTTDNASSYSSSGYFPRCNASRRQSTSDSHSHSHASSHSPSSSVSQSVATSVLSPLSPCFMPGAVVFAEDIWLRGLDYPEKGREMVGSGTTETGEGSVPSGNGVDDDGVDRVGFDGGSYDQDQGRRGRSQGQGQSENDSRDEDMNQQQQQAGIEVRSEGDLEERTNEPGGPEGPEQGNIDDGMEDGGHRSRCCSEAASDMEDDTQAWREKLRRMSLYLPLPPKGRDKRMSLPYLKNMWSRSRRGSLQSIEG